MEFAAVFSALRRQAGLSQRQAAQELGISQALLSHYENGLREPRLDFLVTLCDYFHVTADYLLGRTAERGTSPETASPAVMAAAECLYLHEAELSLSREDPRREQYAAAALLAEGDYRALQPEKAAPRQGMQLYIQESRLIQERAARYLKQPESEGI